MELDRLLNAVGKQTFIKYYNYFKDLTYNSSDISDIITEDYTDKSKRSRLGHASVNIIGAVAYVMNDMSCI